ncbi:MAG: site-specific integrase [Lachnospiraceae bacterium]|nr:site-specific integrase [Lachnospiraceae bacterium]
MLDVEVKLNACKPPRKQNDRSRVYLPDEKEKLFLALNQELLDCPENTDSYGILLLFKLGVRIGELTALKWEDIDTDERELHIHRMESIGDGMKRVVVEYTKKKSPYGDRFLPLGDYEMDIFEKVKEVNRRNRYPDDEFIFCDENGRTAIREIDNRIRKLCTRAGIEVKSAHDIRRTVASEMFNNGVPVEIIRNFLGHSDIRTTYGYILDNKRKEETSRMILDSLENLNGLKKDSKY